MYIFVFPDITSFFQLKVLPGHTKWALMICQCFTDSQKRKEALSVDLICISTNSLVLTHAADPIQMGFVGLSTCSLLNTCAKISLQKESEVFIILEILFSKTPMILKK